MPRTPLQGLANIDRRSLTHSNTNPKSAVYMAHQDPAPRPRCRSQVVVRQAIRFSLLTCALVHVTGLVGDSRVKAETLDAF
jgi:hypothetical protein